MSASESQPDAHGQADAGRSVRSTSLADTAGILAARCAPHRAPAAPILRIQDSLVADAASDFSLVEVAHQGEGESAAGVKEIADARHGDRAILANRLDHPLD